MATGKVHMTDHTRQQLESVGWKAGDPVPGDLGARLQEIVRELEEERASARLEDSELAKGWVKPVASFVNITDLPQEKQKEIQKYLQEYKAEQQQQAEFARMESEADASIPENVVGPQRDVMREQILAGEAAMAARNAARPPGDSVVIDDRVKQAAPPVDMKVPEGKTYAGMLGHPSVADKIEQAAKIQRDHERQQTEQPPPPPAALPSSGANPERTICQRCSWPLQLPFEIVPTIEDKQSFLAAVLGLGRFQKKYELLGGNMVVHFRSLTSDESATLQNQLGAMVRSGESHGDGEYWGNMHEFRMVLAISKIVVGGNATYDVPSLAEWAKNNPANSADPLQPTDIPRLRDHFYAKGATQEPIRRMLGQTHQNFQRLVEALEFMSNEPDFWTGIELPA